MSGHLDPVAQIQKEKERLRKQLLEDEEPGEGEEGKTAETAPVNEPGGEGDQEGNTAATEPAGAEPQAKEEPAGKPEDETWKSKYQVLQGKYDHEVPRLSQEVRQLKTEIESLTAKLQDAATKQTAAEPTVNTISNQELMEELEDRFGPELLEAFTKLAAASKNPELVDRLDQIEKRVKEVSEVSEEQKAEVEFNRLLTAECRNWQKLNEDPAFNQYIRDTLLPTGETLYEVLNAAYENGDVVKVGRIFNSYQPGQTQQSDAAELEAERRRQELEAQAAPVRKGGGESTRIESNKGKVVTQADYEELLREYVGRYDHPDFIKKKAEFRKQLLQ